MGMKFEYQFDASSHKVAVELGGDVIVSEALEAFTTFLRAAGYSLRGDIVIEETPNE